MSSIESASGSHTNDVPAPPSPSVIRIIWSGLAASIVLLAVLALPHAFARNWDTFAETMEEHAADEVLLFFAGGLLEELWAARKDAERARHDGVRMRYELQQHLPLIAELTRSSLLMQAARPLIEKASPIESFEEKKRELAVCLLGRSNHLMEVITTPGNWRRSTDLFAQVENAIEKLVPAMQQPAHRTVMAYLMSLIDPQAWTGSDWANYQRKLAAALHLARERGAHPDFKRIHVVQSEVQSNEAQWQNLISVMTAETLLGFSTQAMLLSKGDVSSLLKETSIGYTVGDVHLFDCGVYQGASDRLSVIADLDLYFLRRRENVDCALVSSDAGLFDILRRNFNCAWRSKVAHSLHTLVVRRPVRLVPGAIKQFIPTADGPDLQVVLDLLARPGSQKDDFFKEFNAHRDAMAI